MFSCGALRIRYIEFRLYETGTQNAEENPLLLSIIGILLGSMSLVFSQKESNIYV